jgi:hypothetical protein
MHFHLPNALPGIQPQSGDRAWPSGVSPWESIEKKSLPLCREACPGAPMSDEQPTNAGWSMTFQEYVSIISKPVFQACV